MDSRRCACRLVMISTNSSMTSPRPNPGLGYPTWRPTTFSVSLSAFCGTDRGTSGPSIGGAKAGSAQHATPPTTPWHGARQRTRPVQRTAPRSPQRPCLGGRALGEHLQERVRFSRDLQRQPRPGRLRSQLSVGLAQPIKLDLLRGTLAPPTRARRRARFTGQLLTPRRDLVTTQVLPTQHRSAMAAMLGQLVVLRDDPFLELPAMTPIPRPATNLPFHRLATCTRRHRHLAQIQSRPVFQTTSQVVSHDPDPQGFGSHELSAAVHRPLRIGGPAAPWTESLVVRLHSNRTVVTPHSVALVG